MVCLIKSKYKEELDQYTELLGSEKRAYAILCCNNGYTLDKTKDGKPSKLYNDLLEYYKGDVRKATQKKAQLFTSDFTDDYGEWFQDGYKVSDEYKDVFDENGEPILFRSGKQVELTKEGISEEAQQKLNNAQSFIKNHLKIKQGPIRNRRMNNSFDTLDDYIEAVYKDITEQRLNLEDGDRYDQIEFAINNTDFESLTKQKLRELKEGQRKPGGTYTLTTKSLIDGFLKNPDLSKYNDEQKQILKIFLPALFKTEDSLTKKRIGFYKHNIQKIYSRIDQSSNQKWQEYFVNRAKQIKLQHFLDYLELSPDYKQQIKEKIFSEINRYVARTNSEVFKNKLEKKNLASFAEKGYGKRVEVLDYSKYFDSSSFKTSKNGRIEYGRAKTSNVLQKIVDDESVDQRLRKSAEFLLKYVKENQNFDIIFLDPGHNRSLSGENDSYSTALGVASTTSRTIYIRVTDTDSNKEHTLIHEIAHSLTTSVLHEQEMGNTEIWRALNRYIQYIDKHLGHSMASIIYNNYWRTNPQEFVAEFFGNAEFQELLKEIPPVDQNKFNNVFEELLNWLYELFTGKPANAFEQIKPVMQGLVISQAERNVIDNVHMLEQNYLENPHFGTENNKIFLDGQNNLDDDQTLVSNPLMDLENKRDYMYKNDRERATDYIKNQGYNISNLRNDLYETRFEVSLQAKNKKEVWRSYIENMNPGLRVKYRGIHLGTKNARLEVQIKTQESNSFDILFRLFNKKSITTANDLLRYIVNQTKGEKNQNFSFVLSVLKDISKTQPGLFDNINVKIENNQNGDYSAKYDANTKTIIINTARQFANENGFDNALVQTLTHELIHTVTIEALQRSKTLRQKAEKLLAELKKQFKDDPNIYGIQDIYEMVAELSNDDFVNKLQQVKYSTKENWLDKIKRFLSALIRSYLNKIGVKYKNTAYQELADIFVQASYSKRTGLEMSDNVDDKTTFNRNARKRLQEAKKKIKSILDQKVPTFGTRDFVQTATDDLIDELTQTIQSKNKSYKSKSNIDSALLGDEQQIARNQETERQVLQAKQTIVDRFKANHTASLLTEKANVILKFLESATSDINNIMSVLENAKANDYDVVYFNKDLQGNRVYTDTNGNITSNTATSNTFMKQFTFDDLSYLTTDITGFYQKVLDDINTFVVYNEYSNNPVVQEIQSLMHDLDVFNKLKRIQILKREAQEKLVDFWLNEKINSIASSEMTDEMKQRLNVNCKKWLRAQYDFGDLTAFTRFCGLMSNSQSPICRMIVEQVYQMNQEVDAVVKEKGDRLEQLLRDTEHEASVLGKYKPGNVMIKLMEVDRNGKYTGDFVQPINSRQFYSDLNDCKAALIYGKNGLEEQVRKLSGNNDYEVLLDDQGDPIIPTDPKFDNIYKNYLRSVEHFMCEHANRMFTEKYYIDRINIMSVTTLRAMKSLNSQIMSLKQSVTINGKFRPDLLTKKQRNELLQLQHDRIMMSNPFDETGELKDPDSVEGIIARDLMAWSELTKDKIKYVTDENAFNEALSNLNTKQEKDLFKEQFTRVAINPKLYETVDKTSYFGNNPDILNVINQLDELRKQRNKLLGINKKGEEFTSYDWSSVFDLKTGNIKNKQLWINLKQLDNKINALNLEYRSYMRLYKDDFDFPEAEHKFSNKFFNGFYSELCVNPSSNFKYSVCFNPNDSVASVFQRMYSQWLVDHNLPASNADIFVDDNGEPLSIFKITVPKAQTFEYEDEFGTKTKEPSYIVKPSNLFSKVDVENSNSEYVNTDFDTSNKSAVQPKQEYYKSERYEEMVKHPKLKALYDQLTFEMGEAYKKLPNFNQYDFRLPQIGANTAAILTRNLSSKYGLQFFANAATVWDRYVNANESDVDDYIPERKFRPDGSEIRSIPIRYVERMQDPEHISSDLVGSVVKFIEMAENYSKRSKNAAFLETLTENVQHYDRSQSNHYKTMRDFIDRSVYEKKPGSVGKNIFADKWDHMDWFRRYFLGGGKTLLKRLGILRASSQIISLAFRGISGAVSWLDPYFSAWIEASQSREYGMRDLIAAHCNIAKESLQALASIGTNKSYSKTMAINDAMGISKRAAEQYQSSYKSQLRRVLTGDYRMSFFEISDYNIRSLIADSITRNYRLYIDPQTGEKMFLNRNDYIEHCRQNGMTTKQAVRQYNNAKKARSCMKVKNGRLQFDQNMTPSEFAKISKATKNMSQKITLMVNQEDRTWLQTNPWTAFVTMLRTFMLCGISERFKTYHDFQVATDEYDDPVTGEHKEIISDRSMSREDFKNAKKKHYYRGGYSFMSGYIENGTYTSGFKGIYRMFTNFKTFKYWFNNYVFHLANMSQEELKKQDISAAEIYNADKIIKEIAVVLGCVVASYLVNEKCKDADPDDDDNYWLFFLNAVLMRIGIERITLYNPQTISDIITCITTLTSSIEKVDDAIDLFTDAVGLGEHNPDEIIKQGQFKNKTRQFRSLINMFAFFGSAGWYATMPKSLGGGGARALYQNAEYYRKNIAPWKMLYTISNSKENKKSNKGLDVDDLEMSTKGFADFDDSI